MAEELPKEVRENILKFQKLQQQLNIILTQKYQMELQVKEAKRALAELGKEETREVHKAIGQLLIRTDKKSIVGELNETVEMVELRLKSLGSQEKKLTDELKPIQDRLQGILGPVEGAE